MIDRDQSAVPMMPLMPVIKHPRFTECQFREGGKWGCFCRKLLSQKSAPSELDKQIFFLSYNFFYIWIVDDLLLVGSQSHVSIYYRKVMTIIRLHIKFTSSIYIVISAHRCIPTVINFETTKFCHHLLQDPISLNSDFNHISCLMSKCHGTRFVYLMISIMGKFDMWPYDGHNVVMLDRKCDWSEYL